MKPEKAIEIIDLMTVVISKTEHQACGVDSYSLQQMADDHMTDHETGDTFMIDYVDDYSMSDDQARRVTLYFAIQNYLRRQDSGEDAIACIKEEWYCDEKGDSTL